MEVLRRSSVFAAEIMDAFDRSPTDKELVAQAKALGREFVHARLLRAGLAWSAPERAAPAPGGRLAEVCAVLLRLADELELIRPSVYRNVARQLNISLQSETVVTDAFLAVAAQIFSAGTLYDWQALFPRLSFVCLSSQESPGARSCPCTQWLRGWPWTACDRPSPPWSTPSWTASGSSCARRWRPGCGDAVDGRMCSSAWSAPTPASARTGSWPRSAASAAS
ncbi:bcl-2-related ovarian killer protein isoform X1 [Balaenoptera acutorostrata]|uniref:Bcl-2-related ovarian killer protein isoform X1 n=1 Tax=Balaenoptera acutorostrata TaxID=9767 RepID=A0ABM3TZG5_BALAC|nr:bcl-2-related ovarian killer protein isoform X1 [Balaenoptera acutorostrata]XP_057407498.1 bcl-2-related ovarian killer protein isoform X1 [Balaenoptera acutorostrata]